LAAGRDGPVDPLGTQVDLLLPNVFADRGVLPVAVSVDLAVQCEQVAQHLAVAVELFADLSGSKTRLSPLSCGFVLRVRTRSEGRPGRVGA
jgi:hypothetical protein